MLRRVRGAGEGDEHAEAPPPNESSLKNDAAAPR